MFALCLTAPPVKLKQSSSSATVEAATKKTIAASSQDTRPLVRQTMRISANLASAPPAPSPTSIASTIPPLERRSTVANPSLTAMEEEEESLGLLFTRGILFVLLTCRVLRLLSRMVLEGWGKCFVLDGERSLT